MAENKLLTESLDALLSGDVETAKRKFDNYYDKLSQNAYKLMESEDFNDFSEEDAEAIVGDAIDAETDEDASYDDILAAVSELEEKYPSEMTDELVARFDDLKNRIDDLRLCDADEDCSEITDDALVALEDLKGDFEVVDGMSDEVVDLFNEIGDKLSGADEEPDEVEAAADVDTHIDDDLEAEKDLTEAVEEKQTVKMTEEGEPELEMAEKDEVVNEPEHQEEDDEEDEEENEIEDDRSIEDLINDAEDNAASMTELLASLKAEMNADEPIEESADVTKVKNPAKAEAAGVVKTGMKMPRPAKVDSDAAMGSSKAGSKGKAVNTSVGKLPAANAAEKMKPVQKPSNKGVADKSVLK